MPSGWWTGECRANEYTVGSNLTRLRWECTCGAASERSYSLTCREFFDDMAAHAGDQYEEEEESDDDL